MTQKTIEYFRSRERAEREAMGTATCVEARQVHEQMADAYARLVQLEDLKAAGAIPSGKVVTIAEALRKRDGHQYGRRSAGGAIAVFPLARSL
jgi:hypothetical protein